MSPSEGTELTEQLDALQKEVRLLRARIAALERLIGNAGEHPSDRTSVREKAVYDWQG